LEPIEFLNLNAEGDATITVNSVNGNVPVLIRNDKAPNYFTLFDDEHVVMDSYDSSISQTLISSKTRCYGQKIPAFTISDDFTPDVDEVLFPYLIAESKSTCFSLFKNGVDQKIEQAARRQKSYIQNDMHRLKQANKRRPYGRR
jgi:hypothetical protein